MLTLDDDFLPGPTDVICGRGKRCYAHVGNLRFRNLVEQRLQEYTKSRTKDEKSHVVMMVVNDVRRESPYGGFVKQNSSGIWYEVGDFLAREKTSQAFRDCLSDRYKSSTVSRRKKRQADRVKNQPNDPQTTHCEKRKLNPSDINSTMAEVYSMDMLPARKRQVSAESADVSKSLSLKDPTITELLQAPRIRRESNISISKELLTDDIMEFGIDMIWDDGDHREHHSLPDTAPASTPGFVEKKYEHLASSASMPAEVNRRDSSSSIGYVLSFLKSETLSKLDTEEDVSSVELDLEPLAMTNSLHGTRRTKSGVNQPGNKWGLGHTAEV